MSSFRFRLDRVLSLRGMQLSIEETDLARLRSELNTIESGLRDLESRQSAETHALRAARSLKGAELAAIADTRKWAIHERKRLQTILADCNRRIELKKASLMEAQRKVRLLERLKENRRAAWTHEQNRALEELAAESAVGSWRRDTAAQPVLSSADPPAPAGPVQIRPRSAVPELPA
jgi:flagellar export protein FliJ